MKINFEHRGNFKRFERFLVKSLHVTPLIIPILEKYGKKGVAALMDATPKKSGKTAESWIYKIVKNGNGAYEIVWSNTNVQNNVNIAILLQYGHATRNGGFVKGTDYINPAIQSIFQEMADEAWKEVERNGRSN